jgi:hypothetical protein
MLVRLDLEFMPGIMDTKHSDNDGITSTEQTPPAAPRGPAAARRAGWALQERILWKGGDRARVAVASAKWPLESVAWKFRSRIAWPLKDAFDRSGPIGRTALAGAAVVLLGGVGAAGAYVANGGSGADGTPAPRVAAASPPPVERVIPPLQSKPAADTRVLEGATPTFGPEGDAAKAGGAAGGDAVAAASSQAGSGTVNTGGAQGSTKEKTVGPAPLMVAHRFADAFVSYEVGKADPKVRKVFRKTATQPLAKSLAKRPPRQPATVRVPRARVLNVVPGPRSGASVSVSVSLLRVGATSELRLQLQQVRRKWLVSDVRG